MQAIGQDQKGVFPLDVALEMVGMINLIWMKRMVWEKVEKISFQFARDPTITMLLEVFAMMKATLLDLKRNVQRL